MTAPLPIPGGGAARTCDACASAVLIPFADLGEIPVLCGVHWADAAAAASSPVGQMTLAYCPNCAYVRNVAYDPSVMVYDTTMDTNLHHSAAFQAFSTTLATHLSDRYHLHDKQVLDIGCGQGEFLRELCHVAGCTGVGYDAMYAGPTAPDGSGAVFHSQHAPRGAALGEFDLVTSRHWFEHVDDPYDFLLDLRQRAGQRPVNGYLEVPDAGYDLSTAGWEVIYPHVSYFDEYSLARIAERAGWRVEDSGVLFSGMFRFIEISANREGQPRLGSAHPADRSSRDRHLTTLAGFSARQRNELASWRERIASLAGSGGRPVLWGAGSRGVQFLNLADPDRHLAAVVDVNPRKWGRFLPVTAHRVDPPSSLTDVAPSTVIITNPAYRSEIAADLARLGVTAQLLIA